MTILEEQAKALSILLSGMTESDQLYYASIPDAFVSTNEEGVVSFMERFSFSVTAGSSTLVLTPCLDQETKIWHVDESYSVDANDLWSGQSLMYFNTTIHNTNQYYSYVLLSSSSPSYPELGDPNYADLLRSYPTRCVLAYASSVIVLLRHAE